MADFLFHIFPNENFIDLCLYQYGYEKCNPGHSFGPAVRNHYLFHYILSGTGTLLADDTKGITQNYQIRSGQGFMIFPGQVTTYIADSNVPWEYLWVEFDGLRITEALSMTDFSKNKPVYHPHNKELRDKLADELMYISHHPKESPFHLIGHLYLFLDYLIQSAHSTQLLSNNKMSDYYIKEAINYIEQNFQNNITIEDVASVCGINRSYLGNIFKKIPDSLHRNFSSSTVWKKLPNFSRSQIFLWARSAGRSAIPTNSIFPELSRIFMESHPVLTAKITNSFRKMFTSSI